MSPETQDVVQIGHITSPSGTVVVVDMGLMHLWCHDRPPTLSIERFDESEVAKANSCVEFEIVGPDAEEAGERFDRDWTKRFIFDVPAEGESFIRETFDKLTADHGLCAQLVRLGHRITHRERIDIAIEVGRGCGELTFHGVWGCAAVGLPRDRAIPVLAQRMPPGLDERRWRSVWLQVSDAKTAITRAIGYVAVDEARLMFADVEALGAWRHDESLDGLADYVFWGKDAEAAAQQASARHLGNGNWGWRDLPIEEVLSYAEVIRRVRNDAGMKFASDFRPHSHQYPILQQIRESESESGITEVGSATVCGFMTTWGDGLFPVIGEFDDARKLARIRIDLGNEKIVQRQRRFEELWFGEFAKHAYVSNKVWKDSARVGWLFRTQADRSDDSGWQVFAGTESQEYVEDPANTSVVPLRELIERDRTLEDIFRKPVGSAFERRANSSQFEAVDDFDAELE